VRDLELLIAARTEAENYLTTQRMSPETSAMVKRARSDRQIKLGGVG
jgi:hypothetical protein